MTLDEARTLLTVADVFYGDDEEATDEENTRSRQTLNQNDVWGWALAWGEYIEDAELPEVARLFLRYGWCGLYYWVSEKHGQMRSEFEDINRFVAFVRNEEVILKDFPNSSERAYLKTSYVI